MTAALTTRVLGRTGVPLTVLGYGAMELRNADHPGARPVEPGQADRVLSQALDAGVNFIDTSPDYGDSEEAIGRALGARRDEFVLASKCGCPLSAPGVHPRDAPHAFTRDNIVAVLERSLRRLRTDHIDLLQFHTSPSREVLERDSSIETLLELREQGKIRFIGSSSTLPNAVDHIAMGVFDELQLPYSPLRRDHEEVIASAAAAGIGIVARGAVASGGVARGGAGPAHDERAPWAQWEAAKLDELLDGDTRATFMLRFALSNPAVTTTIVGTLSTDHLAQNITAAQRGPLPASTCAEARRRLDSTA